MLNLMPKHQDWKNNILQLDVTVQYIFRMNVEDCIEELSKHDHDIVFAHLFIDGIKKQVSTRIKIGDQCNGFTTLH